MTYNKSTAFDTKQQEIAKIAKVLSHPARIAILEHLAKTKSCISGDIAQELPLSRTTVSQHLQELKNAGLIKGQIEGLTVSYCIDAVAFATAKKLLGNFLTSISDNLATVNNCC